MSNQFLVTVHQKRNSVHIIYSEKNLTLLQHFAKHCCHILQTLKIGNYANE